MFSIVGGWKVDLPLPVTTKHGWLAGWLGGLVGCLVGWLVGDYRVDD